MALGERTGLSASMTAAETVDDLDAGARRARRRARDDRPSLGAPAVDRRFADAHAGRERVGDQMRAVEQEHVVGARRARRRGSARRAGSGGW